MPEQPDSPAEVERLLGAYPNVEEFLDGVGEPDQQDGEWLGLIWPEDASIVTKAIWLDCAATALKATVQYQWAVRSLGDNTPFAAGAVDDLRQKLWSYAQSEAEQYPEHDPRLGKKLAVESEVVASDSHPVGILDVMGIDVPVADETEPQSEWHQRRLERERGIKQLVIDDALRGVMAIAEHEYRLPDSFYAHYNARQLLSRLEPALAGKIQSMSVTQAADALLEIGNDYLLRRINLRRGRVSKTYVQRAWNTMATVVLASGGMNIADMARIEGFAERSGPTFLTHPKSLTEDMQAYDYTEIIDRHVYPNDDRYPSVASVIPQVAKKLAPDVGKVIDENLRPFDRSSLLDEERRVLLTYIFPAQAGRIKKLHFGELHPVLLHIAAAYVLARQSYYAELGHGNNIREREAMAFIDRFFGISASRSAIRYDFSQPKVIYVADAVVAQVLAYDRADIKDIACLAFGMAPTSTSTPPYERKPPEHIMKNDGSLAFKLSDFRLKPPSRPVADEARNVDGPKVKPTPKPKPDEKSSPVAQAATVDSRFKISINAALVEIEDSTRDPSLPFTAETVRLVGELSFKARLRLNEAERQLLTDVFNSSGKQLPSMADAAHAWQYRHLSDTEFRALVSQVVSHMAKLASPHEI